MQRFLVPLSTWIGALLVLCCPGCRSGRPQVDPFDVMDGWLELVVRGQAAIGNGEDVWAKLGLSDRAFGRTNFQFGVHHPVRLRGEFERSFRLLMSEVSGEELVLAVRNYEMRGRFDPSQIYFGDEIVRGAHVAISIPDLSELIPRDGRPLRWEVDVGALALSKPPRIGGIRTASSQPTLLVCAHWLPEDSWPPDKLVEAFRFGNPFWFSETDPSARRLAPDSDVSLHSFGREKSVVVEFAEDWPDARKANTAWFHRGESVTLDMDTVTLLVLRPIWESDGTSGPSPMIYGWRQENWPGLPAESTPPDADEALSGRMRARSADLAMSAELANYQFAFPFVDRWVFEVYLNGDRLKPARIVEVDGTAGGRIHVELDCTPPEDFSD